MDDNKAIIDELGTENISVGTRKVGKIRKIVVDRDACIGARSCVVITPQVFQMDDENLAYVPKDSNLDLMDDELIKMSAESCPVLAIHLYDEDGNKVFPES